MSDKPYKIENLEAVLAKVAPERREAMQAEIEELFKDFDPEDPPGEPVPELASGVSHCPACGKELEIIGLNRQVPGLEPIDILTCEPCDMDYVRPTSVQ